MYVPVSSKELKRICDGFNEVFEMTPNTICDELDVFEYDEIKFKDMSKRVLVDFESMFENSDYPEIVIDVKDNGVNYHLSWLFGEKTIAKRKTITIDTTDDVDEDSLKKMFGNSRIKIEDNGYDE